jgi:hypothetical protein
MARFGGPFLLKRYEKIIMNLTTKTSAQDSASQQVTSAAVACTDVPVIDRYADSVMRGCEHLYDSFEIHGVRDLLAGTGASDTHYEIDNVNPQSFSVYAHQIVGGVDAVGDFSSYQLAAGYAGELSELHNMPMFDYVPDVLKGRKALQ